MLVETILEYTMLVYYTHLVKNTTQRLLAHLGIHPLWYKILDHHKRYVYAVYMSVKNTLQYLHWTPLGIRPLR